ncbi:MAG: FG-GAP-like repeat-containing protein [Planctomycetia bacterium]|nr:FG-GAP-like repeat-containing protein [Planctomycetia bacterium]
MRQASIRLRSTHRRRFELLEQRALLSVSAVQNGQWSEPATWGGSVPSGSDSVLIAGFTVVYDLPANGDSEAEAKDLLIRDGGELYFSRQSATRLDFDGSLTVRAGGILNAGTSADPIPANVSAYIGFNVANDRLFSSNDPNDSAFQPGPDPSIPDYHPEDTGLWVIEAGSIATFRGAPKLSWTKLADDAVAGSTQVVVSDAAQGWRAGDRVVITPASPGADEVEVRTIVSVSGNQVRFDEALAYAHEGSLYAYDTIANTTREIVNESELFGTEILIPLQAEVGLLTHNVTLASNLVTEGDPNHRAHTAYLAGASGSIAFTEFRDLGPRAKLGRYPLHFHEVGPLDGGSGFEIASASIWNSTSDPGNKFLSIHGTDGVVVRDTVGFNAQGAGFYLESANERGNRLEHNLGVLVYGPEELPGQPGPIFEYPTTAAAVYWVREGNEFVDNVAAAGAAGAAGYWMSPNRLDTSSYPTVFLANEAHSNDTGLYYSGGADLTLETSTALLWRNKVGLQATTLPVNATTESSVFLGNSIDHTTPFPGENSGNVFVADPQSQPWQGFVDKYLELGTNLYTFGPQGVGNPNYYDGDFGDFDGDGLMDRALVARYGLLWNTGQGFMNPVAGREGVGQSPRQNLTGFIYREGPDNSIGGLGDDGINFADVDNDGDLDVISGGNGETFAIQENLRGRFRFKSLDLSHGQFVSAWQIVNTDLERDGDVDLVVSSGFPYDFNLLVNDGQGTFTEQSASRGLNLAADPPHGTVSGDVDRDGDYDLLMIKGDQRFSPELGITIAKNNGNGVFNQSFAPFARSFPVLPDIRVQGDSNQSMSLGDIDDDGDLDLIIALGRFFTDHNLLNETIGSHPVVSHAIFVNDGQGNFAEESAARWDIGSYIGEILRGDNGELVDVDYDGDLDFIALRRDTGTDIKQLQFYLNDGSGHFAYSPNRTVVIAANGNDFGNDVDVTDLDGDGAYDIWLGMAGDRVHPLINTFENPSGQPADMPRNLQVIAADEVGVTLSWQAPEFAATARYYKVYRSTSPSLARTERELVKVVGESHQDEGFSAPIDRWTTTEELGDPEVSLNGGRNEVRFTDRSAKPGITYYYSVVHVGTENTPSQPTPEASASMPVLAGVDTTVPSLIILKPTPDEWSQYPEIVLQYADGGSGIDLSSLRVSFNRSFGGLPAGTDLSDSFVYKDDKLFLAPFEGDRALPQGAVTLSASIADSAGNVVAMQRTFNVRVTADQRPSAVIATSPAGDRATFAFSGALSRDGEGAVMRYEWYFPDGTTAIGKDVTWRAPGAGDFQVELYVWDDRGGVDEAEVQVSVAASRPGDTDDDDDVDLADLNAVRNNFGETGPGVIGDTFPFDGVVDLQDLNAVRNYFGEAAAGTAEFLAFTSGLRSANYHAHRLQPSQFLDSRAVDHALEAAIWLRWRDAAAAMSPPQFKTKFFRPQ